MSCPDTKMFHSRNITYVKRKFNTKDEKRTLSCKCFTQPKYPKTTFKESIRLALPYSVKVKLIQIIFISSLFLSSRILSLNRLNVH